MKNMPIKNWEFVLTYTKINFKWKGLDIVSQNHTII